MEPYNEVLKFISTPPLLVLFICLIFIGGVIWCYEKSLGFHLIYLTMLSMSISYLILSFSPVFYVNEQVSPLTQPFIQTIMTGFSFFIPLTKHRFQVLLCLIPPIVISIFFLFITPIHVFSIVNGILIGGFIVYSFYRSLDWISGMPEPYLISLASIIPLFFAFMIFPMEEYLIYPGILLGSGLGIFLELMKVRQDHSTDQLIKNISGFVIGVTGLLVIYSLREALTELFPYSMFFAGVITGFWMTFIVPFLLVSLKIRTTEKKTQVY